MIALASTRRANDALEACYHLCNDAVASSAVALSRDARKCLALPRSGTT